VKIDPRGKYYHFFPARSCPKDSGFSHWANVEALANMKNPAAGGLRPTGKHWASGTGIMSHEVHRKTPDEILVRRKWVWPAAKSQALMAALDQAVVDLDSMPTDKAGYAASWVTVRSYDDCGNRICDPLAGLIHLSHSIRTNIPGCTIFGSQR